MILDNYKDKGRRKIRAQKPQTVPRSSKSCDGKQTELAVVLKITPINRETLTIVRVIIEFYSIIYLQNVFTFFPTSSSIILLSKPVKCSKNTILWSYRIAQPPNQISSKSVVWFTSLINFAVGQTQSLPYAIRAKNAQKNLYCT